MGNNMKYKKCPKCELNYITEDEELCAVCRPQIKTTSQIKKVETEVSTLKFLKTTIYTHQIL